MPNIKVSTQEEVNKAVYDVAKLIQKLCDEGTDKSISQVSELIQPAAELIKVSINYID